MDRRAAELAARLREAGAALVALVEHVEPPRWNHVPAPGVWSVGKEAEHVAEGTAYHRWIVLLTIGKAAPSRRPSLERAQLTTRLPRAEVVALLRRRTEEGAAIVERLTDAQLALPTRPPRAREQTLGTTIERVLIGHYQVHHTQIASKLQVGAEPG